MKKDKARVEKLYHEYIADWRENIPDSLNAEPPDIIRVAVTRWYARHTGEVIVILSRFYRLEGTIRIDDDSVVTTVDRYDTPALQRLGIRVFDELKANHPAFMDK